jgi:hypothetical protein
VDDWLPNQDKSYDQDSIRAINDKAAEAKPVADTLGNNSFLLGLQVTRLMDKPIKHRIASFRQISLDLIQRNGNRF